MAEITAALVKQLRDATNVSMMDCKRALVETEGDVDKAALILRERGMAVAAKRATRTANQGLIASACSDDGRIASLIEVNCETDFVARNENFATFVASLADEACRTDDALAETLKDDVTAKIGEIGENIVVKRNTRFALQDGGTLASYIHLGGKVGVLLELGCEKQETADNAAFNELARDLTLHVAACNPTALTADEVPPQDIEAERAIYAKQVADKPPQIIGKIVEGKIKKYLGEICLLNQGFVKEPKQSATALLEEKGKELTDTVTIRRFVRYQLGG